ncbi:hypothetical protein [Altericista sp. CCNU0014]|uniref:hypothetical protein n=1 Tax=Altericista sp. CCNU0014 TaxID=3082949 RepID=UPI00384AE7CD
MNHFQPKTLAFYGGAIASVVGLFGLVTAYGEANLKTAQSIGGDYLLELPTSTNCDRRELVALSVQQSGVYVAASMVNQTLKRSPATFQPLTLNGQWQNGQLILTGNVPTKMLCINSKERAPMTVKLEGAIASHQKSAPHSTSNQPVTLTGTLSLNQTTTPFTAKREPIPKDAEK